MPAAQSHEMRAETVFARPRIWRKLNRQTRSKDDRKAALGNVVLQKRDTSIFDKYSYETTDYRTFIKCFVKQET